MRPLYCTNTNQQKHQAEHIVGALHSIARLSLHGVGGSFGDGIGTTY